MPPTDKIHPNLPCYMSEVVLAVKIEMACTLADMMARRLRALFLDARASMEVAPAVAATMRQPIGKDAAWERAQVAEFNIWRAVIFPKAYNEIFAASFRISKPILSTELSFTIASPVLDKTMTAV